MGKNEGKWTTITIPRDLYEMVEEGARLKGCTPAEFFVEAIELAIEEEKRKMGK